MQNIKKKHPIFILLLCVLITFSFIPIINILYMALSAMLTATNAGWLKWILLSKDMNRFDSIRCMLMIIPSIFIYRHLQKQSASGTLNWSLPKGNLYSILTGIGFCGIAFLWIQFAEKFLSKSEWIHKSLLAMSDTVIEPKLPEFLLLILAAGILVPILEELLFRGIIFSMLEKIKKGWFAVVVSAILFAFAHMNLIQGVYTFIMGLISGFIYLKTKDLRWTILMHMTINTISAFTSLAFMQAYLPIWNLFTVIMIIPVLLWMWKWSGRAEKTA